MKKPLPFILLSVILLLGCTHKDSSVVNDEVVLIFENYNPKPFKTPAGLSRLSKPLMAYIDDAGDYTTYSPDFRQDTLIISCAESIKEVALNYRNFENVYYHFIKGDTVLITMDSLDYPVVQSKHFQDHDRLYHLNANLRKERTHFNLEAKTCLGEYVFIRIGKNIDFINKQGWNMAKDYCPIDTLQKWHNDYKNAYMDSINLYKKLGIIDDHMYDRLNELLVLKDVESQLWLNTDTAYYHSLETGLNDKFLDYPSYYDYIGFYMQYFDKHIPLIVKPQGSNADWRICFDEIAGKNLDTGTKKILLSRCMEHIANNFSADDVNLYLDKYVAITDDTVLKHDINREYNLEADADKLLLKDIAGNETTIKEVLEALKGKVVYLDFWASWCAPCRAEMEPAITLRKNLKDKNVAFVYLAFNDTEDKWKKAVAEEGLEDIKTNYFIMNSKNSKFLENISLSLIPRYLIIDKDGQIAELNAPRPSGDAKRVIEKYLGN